MKIFLIVPVLLMVSSAALYWSDVPLAPAHSDSGDCASCHDGSVPRNHSEAFIRVDHGPAAFDDRQSCMGCHQSNGCDDCHLSEKPQWHSTASCDPAGSPANRDEHVRIGAAHRTSCMECHSMSFQTQCALCHLPEEWPR